LRLRRLKERGFERASLPRKGLTCVLLPSAAPAPHALNHSNGNLRGSRPGARRLRLFPFRGVPLTLARSRRRLSPRCPPAAPPRRRAPRCAPPASARRRAWRASLRCAARTKAPPRQRAYTDCCAAARDAMRAANAARRTAFVVRRRHAAAERPVPALRHAKSSARGTSDPLARFPLLGAHSGPAPPCAARVAAGAALPAGGGG
jgi:hypothetical protein